MGRPRPAGFTIASLSTLSRPATLFDSGEQVVKPDCEAVTMVNANPYSRPEFIWRFYSCQKHNYHLVIASTEAEARSQLPDAPCIFSARFSTEAHQYFNCWNAQIIGWQGGQ